MVRINIYVPCVNETFHFSLEEKERISFIINGVSKMAEEKCDGVGTIDKKQEYLLVSQSHGRILNPDKTLAYYDVRTGDALILL